MIDSFPEFSSVRLLRDVTQHGQRVSEDGVWMDHSEMMLAGSRGAVVHIYNDGAAYEVEFFDDAHQTIGVFTVAHDDLERC